MGAPGKGGILSCSACGMGAAPYYRVVCLSLHLCRCHRTPEFQHSTFSRLRRGLQLQKWLPRRSTTSSKRGLCLGSLAMQARASSSSSVGVSSGNSRRLRWMVTWKMTCIWSRPDQGRWPVHISQSRTPNAYTSAALLSLPAMQCSHWDLCQGLAPVIQLRLPYHDLQKSATFPVSNPCQEGKTRSFDCQACHRLLKRPWCHPRPLALVQPEAHHDQLEMFLVLPSNSVCNVVEYNKSKRRLTVYCHHFALLMAKLVQGKWLFQCWDASDAACRLRQGTVN